jgi:hypothetical protein
VGIVAAGLGGGGIGNGSQAREAIRALFGLLVERGLSPYLYSVGKEVNAAKLSNFADSIDCFVVVACPQRTLRILQELDRECSVPVVSPMEVAAALDCIEWGRCRLRSRSSIGRDDSSCDSPWHLGYSVDLDDFLDVVGRSMSPLSDQNALSPDLASEKERSELGDDEMDEDDAPYFSLVTGRYESQAGLEHRVSVDRERDLSRLPGQGVLTRYRSAAAEALKQREYKGLRPEIGSTAVSAALPGQQGIASDYGNR